MAAPLHRTKPNPWCIGITRLCYAKAVMMTTPACHSVYVHVPFCRRLCGYCDFYSQVLDPAAAGPLVDALRTELERATADQEFRFDTLFVGGGTPTVLPVPDLQRLLTALQTRLDSAAPVEFTVEANPATVTPDTAAVLQACGVNRVSVGAQSFIPAELHILQRTHQPAEVAQTVRTLRSVGIPHLSLDLIFGIPGQTLVSWQASLRAALDLEPEHLSCYGLTYEPDTPLYDDLVAGRITRLDSDLEADLYEATMDTLAAAGLPQYEISNYARPGAECRHNLRYWHNEPYLGLGPAAAGFINEIRYKNVADTAAYVDAIKHGASPWSEHETLPPDRRARETAMLELRLVRGIDRARFATRYGVEPTTLFADAIARHVAGGLLEVDGVGIRLTRAGRLLGDRVMADFL